MTVAPRRSKRIAELHEKVSPDKDIEEGLFVAQSDAEKQHQQRSDERARRPTTEIDEASRFAAISGIKPHQEPGEGDTVGVVKFRLPENSFTRRFSGTDCVERLFEWLKASPPEGMAPTFSLLVANGLGGQTVNLIEQLDSTIANAGLIGGSVMIVFENDDE